MRQNLITLKRTIGLLFFKVLLVSLFLLPSCTCDNDKETANILDDRTQELSESVSLKVSDGEQILRFSLGGGYLTTYKSKYFIIKSTKQWCKSSIGNNYYSRNTNITHIYTKDHQKSLKVLQRIDFSDYFMDIIYSKFKKGITEAGMASIPNRLKMLLIQNSSIISSTLS